MIFFIETICFLNISLYLCTEINKTMTTNFFKSILVLVVELLVNNQG